MPRWVKVTRWFRWPAAAAILLVGIIGGFRHWFETCSQVVDGGKVFETCADPSVTDGAVVFVGILFLLLIAPDFDEAGLFGFALKRRVAQQEERQRQLESQLTVVSSKLEAVATAAAMASATFNLQLTADFFREIRSQVDRKEHEFDTLVSQSSAKVSKDGGPEELAPRETDTPGAGSDAGLRAALLQITEELERLMFKGEYPGSDVRDLRWAFAQDDLKSQFRSLFAQEIEVVRAARSAVVHNLPLDNDVLGEAVDVARELVRIARRAVVPPGQAPPSRGSDS